MQIRFPSASTTPLRIIVAATLVLIAAGCNKGSIGTTDQSGGGLGAPAPTLTPIESCADADHNVVVGGSSGKKSPGCNLVNAAPTSATAQFGEIIVKSGGLLTVPAGATGLNPLKVADICLESGSKFIVGSPTSQTKFKIIFTGDKSAAGSSDPVCQGGGLNHDQNFKKGIDVTQGATLELYGAKGVPSRGGVSWTTLAAPAGSIVPGAKVRGTGTLKLLLTADVTQGAEGWQKGDWIVVGTTSFNPFDSEFVQIDTVHKDSKSGSIIKLKQPLQYYHFGSPAPSTGTSAACPDRLGNPGPASYCDGANQNYGVDERAEVGLISRDIMLTADTEPVTTAPPATSSVHWGGEIMIHAGFTKVAIQGVQLEKLGKDQLGSYPIHFHMVGNIGKDQSALIDADSVDHSYNKCVTLHDMANLTVSNMVCARIVGHIFYEELDNPSNADDSGITFQDNLGLGAMSNSFDINPVTLIRGGKMTRQQLINQYWWTGDYMTNAECSTDGTCIGYDGFNIPDTDNWNQPTHGTCASYQNNGILGGFGAPTPGTSAACSSANIYIEPATGFWIQNPATNLIGNAIGGCQGLGNGLWWVPPRNPIMVNGRSLCLQFQKLGTVEDNRAHACYNGFFDDNSIGNVTSGQLFPQTTTTFDGSSPSVIATLDGVTATRNRFRGLWLRPTWMVVKNGHFATNRDNVTLLTSGGIDGNAPGVWDLLEDSVLIGLSLNNVERWGPSEPQPTGAGHRRAIRLHGSHAFKFPAQRRAIGQGL